MNARARAHHSGLHQFRAGALADIAHSLGCAAIAHWAKYHRSTHIAAAFLVAIERAREFAGAWGSEFIDIGFRGHINTAAGIGAWPEGRTLLQKLTTGLQATT